MAAHYDELDAFYREVWGDHVHHGLWRTGRETHAEAVRALALQVANAAGLVAGCHVCDIGCGYGATARMLALEFGAEVTALTISPAQHRYACSLSNSAGNPLYLLGDWLANDLPAGSFDAAVAIESAEHMPDLERFFAQAYRVLRPGGRLVVCGWLASEAPTAWQRRHLLEPICQAGRMPQLVTEGECLSQFKAAGFIVTEMLDLSRQVAATWPRMAAAFVAKVFTSPSYLRLVLQRDPRHRVFAFTVYRLWWAFGTGALRYGLFVGDKRA